MKLMPSLSINIHSRLMDFSVPRIMAILNVTPDSFAVHCDTVCEADVLKDALAAVQAGADILDIGGCSTRPGSVPVDETEEWRRVSLALHAVRSALPDIPISVDTFRPMVARRAVEEGADMINDVSGGQTTPEMWEVVSRTRVPYIIGYPAAPVNETDAVRLQAHMLDFFQSGLDRLYRMGVADVVLDPCFGFAKTQAQNYTLLNHLDVLQVLQAPVLVGVSRKSMLCNPLQLTPDTALNATTAAHMMALERGANILRVHDVAAAKEAIKIYQLTRQN